MVTSIPKGRLNKLEVRTMAFEVLPPANAERAFSSRAHFPGGGQKFSG
jgi:hypothetical protein